MLLEVNGKEILCADETGSKIKIKLEDPWVQFLPFLNKLDMLYVEAENNVISKEGLLVIEPHYLVAVTSVIDAISCPRKVYVRTMGAEKVTDLNVLKRMLQGNLLHDVFSYKLARGMDVTNAIDLALQDAKLDLLASDTDENEAKKYLERDAGAIDGVGTKGLTELDCQNWNLGLHGKFDGIINDQIIELKSSKIPQGTPWPNHNIQMNIYLQMMEEYGKHMGMVLYVNDGEMGFALPTHWEKHRTVIGRNYAYLVQSGRLLPKVLRGDDAKACRYCYVKEGCWQLCAGMKTQRDCENCLQAPICTKEEWKEPHQQYFDHFTQALMAEERDSLSESYLYSRVCSTDKRFRKRLVDDGFAVITTEKIDEQEHGSSIVTTFRQVSNTPRFRKGDFAIGYDLSKLHDTTTLFYSLTIVNLDSEKITVSSVNPLPENMGIVPTRFTYGLRGGRKAVFYAMFIKNPLLDIIIKSFSDSEFKLEPLPEALQKISKPKMPYNEVQEKAIMQSMVTPDFFMIQGPAGTGKTSVIVELVRQFLFKGRKILCTAYTNMAVDNIGKKLQEAGIDFLRLGNEWSMHESLQVHSPFNKEDLFKSMLEKKEPLVVLSTTTTIGNDLYEQVLFDYVILDEAAQMTEPDALRPILRGEKAILVGDHAQLQPIVTSPEAREKELHVSLFERLAERFPERFIRLTKQYRMNDEILYFPNNEFYDGQLEAGSPEIARQQLPQFEGLYIGNKPYEVLVIENPTHNEVSPSNNAEVLATFYCFMDLMNTNVPPKAIGIIAPFRAQVALLRTILPYPEVEIDTIDRYQGSEREVIILSTVTSHQVPLLTDEKRINVALTRAKKKLVILVTNPDLEHPRHLVDRIAMDAMKRGLIQKIRADELTEIGYAKVKEWQGQIFEKLGMTAPEFPKELFEKEELIAEETIPSKLFFSTFQLELSVPTTITQCLICMKEVEIGIMCPGCQYWYHEDHLLEWVSKRPYCPLCKHSIVIET